MTEFRVRTAAGDELDVRKAICQDVRRGSCEILIDDTESYPLWSDHPSLQRHGFRSYPSVPILLGGSFFGTLCAIDREPRGRPLAEVRDQRSRSRFRGLAGTLPPPVGLSPWRTSG